MYSVHFYGKVVNQEKRLLFTILFGGDEGDQRGVVMQDNAEFITVNVLVTKLELDGARKICRYYSACRRQ